MLFSGIMISAPDIKMSMFLLLFATFVVIAQSNDTGKRHTSKYNAGIAYTVWNNTCNITHILFLSLDHSGQWIEGRVCRYGYVQSFFNGFYVYPDLDTAKAKCAEGCDTNDYCKFANLHTKRGIQVCKFYDDSCGPEASPYMTRKKTYRRGLKTYFYTKV